MKYQAILAVTIVICCFTSVKSQVTNPTNVPNVNHWVGYNNTSGIVLPIENRGFPEISISSNGNEKMNFNELATWNGLNGMTENDVSRIHLGLNGNFQNPFSMIHMGTNINTNLQRPWMNVGMTMGANNDIMYMGLLERPKPDSPDAQQVDAVIAWGCNDSIAVPGSGPDNLRFLFIAPDPPFPPGSTPGDASEEQGRETMRISPMGYVGIGDFSHMPNGLDEQPTQRLDVNGTARLRQMPNDSAHVIITGVEADATGDYILNYATFEDIGNELGICDWDVVNAGADVATGYPGGCVEGEVLIGTDNQTGTAAKVFMTKDYAGTTLRAIANSGSGSTQTGGEFVAEFASTVNTGVGGTAFNSRFNRGVDGRAERAQNLNEGVRGQANNGPVNMGVRGSSWDGTSINYGVHGTARGGEELFAPTNNVGVYGRAWDYASVLNFGGYFVACDAEKNIGLYAEACGEMGTAAHFAGGIVEMGGILSLSDENIKTDINEIESALSVISQLQPKQYYFNTADYSHLNLKSELSYGFSAQQMQEVLPEIVGEIYHPAKFDSLGEETSPSEDLLGIHYQELIAILTAGIKEQQTQISEQAQTIDDLQQSLNNQNDLIAQMMDQMDALADHVNNCCDGDFKYNAPDQGQGNLKDDKKSGGNVLDQNTPNPFRSQTNISYTLEQGGKVSLNIFDKTGKPIATLAEAEQSAGTYRYEWNASGLPAGLYHYALYVDGELLVKKAIKLAD